MRKGGWLSLLVVAPLVAGGCAQLKNATFYRADYSHQADDAAYAVRFVLPEGFEPAGPDFDARVELTSHQWTNPSCTTCRGPVTRCGKNVRTTSDTFNWSTPVSPHHVVLWGKDFYGTDVTFASAPLQPGPYVFRFFDVDEGSIWQGWLSVNASDGLLDTYRQWRDGVIEYKQWLGYEANIQGKFDSGDADDFAGFQKQIREMDRLERRITRAIAEEAADQAQFRRDLTKSLNFADILLMPGGTQAFFPTTEPTFTENDIDTIENGQPVTKLVLAADYDRTMEKLQRVNNLRDDLKGVRAVLQEEAKRLARRKQFYTVTDHLYHHDKCFVTNEVKYQQTLAQIDRINDQLAGCRERAVGLAFVAEMLTPNSNFDVLTQVRRDLERERTVFQTEMERIEALYGNSKTTSAHRVNLENERQQLVAVLEDIDRQFSNVKTARNTLASLTNTTEVIFRNGPMRLVSATVVDDSVPVQVANALDNEAVLTVRLDKVNMPEQTTTTITEFNSEEYESNRFMQTGFSGN